jgi:hypothetical protein
MTHTWVGIAFLALLVLTPVALAATTATTLFTFRVPTTKSISVTYGGNCSATAFFFNELDANFDPDVDGNAAKVKPSSVRIPYTQVAVDYNFAGVSAPADFNRGHTGVSAEPPATSGAPNTEMTTSDYNKIAAADLVGHYTSTINNNRRPAVRFQFYPQPHPELITDLNFYFVGQSKTGDSCATDGGTDADMNGYLWNYSTLSWDRIFTWDATSGVSETNFNPQTLWADINTNITNYATVDRNIIFLVHGQQPNGTNLQCLAVDFARLTITAPPVDTNFCQSSSLAPITLTNNGNVDVNVDGNFASAFSGADVNIVLKAWQGSSGCGNTGFGGWEKDCSVTSTTSPVTTTTCKNYNQFNATTASRLVSTLTVGSSSQLCFSGDFNTLVYAGDHNGNFQAGVLYS